LAKGVDHQSFHTKAHRVMILVTGGTGLVGSHLLFELTKKGKSVKAIFRNQLGIELVKKLFSVYSIESEAQFSKIEWVKCDTTDYDAVVDVVRGVKAVYHCAAMVSFNPSRAEAMVYNNVQGTANLVDASLALGVDAFCHVSSIAALGEPNPQGYVDEQCGMGKMKRHSAYARSKFFSENEVWRGIEQGLSAVIVNPSVIIGPGNWSAGSGVIFSTIAKGFPFYTLGASGYVYVIDVVRAMVQLTELERWGQRYLLSAENISHREVFSLIAKELGKKPPSIRVRPWMANTVVPFAWLTSKVTGNEPLLTRETAKSGENITRYSAEKVVKEIGLKFTPMAEAIKQTAHIYKRNLF
jgi:dihydroflavonol-4-reductase